MIIFMLYYPCIKTIENLYMFYKIFIHIFDPDIFRAFHTSVYIRKGQTPFFVAPEFSPFFDYHRIDKSFFYWIVNF